MTTTVHNRGGKHEHDLAAVHHVAGHVVMSFLVRDILEGPAGSESEVGTGLSLRGRKLLEAEILVSEAGAEAELIATGRRGGSAADFARGIDVLEAVLGGHDEAAAVLIAQRVKANALLRKHWDAVRFVAESFLAKRTPSESRVEALIAAAAERDS